MPELCARSRLRRRRETLRGRFVRSFRRVLLALRISPWRKLRLLGRPPRKFHDATPTHWLKSPPQSPFSAVGNRNRGTARGRHSNGTGKLLFELPFNDARPPESDPFL
jgi:hypothetical protein